MKKKVMYVVRPVEGGIREHLKVLIQYLSPSYDLVVVCPYWETLAGSFQRAGARVIPLDISGKLNFFIDFPQALSLARIIQKERPDLIHLHGFKAGFLGRISSLVSHKIPVVLTVHSYLAHPEKSKMPFFCYQQAEKILSRRVSRIITVSDALKDCLTGTLGVRKEIVTRIYNGINYEQFQDDENKDSDEKTSYFKKCLGIQQGIPLVGTAARMAPQKGLGVFIEAADIIIKEGRSCLFLLAGDGPMKGELENRVRDLRLEEKVIFPGRVQDIAGFLSCLDIFVLPSLSEGLSITLLEALAAGKPVIASRVGGVPEIVIDGFTGGLVPPGDPVSLASKVNGFLDHPEQSKVLGIQGRRRARNYFTLEEMISKTEGLYKELWT